MPAMVQLSGRSLQQTLMPIRSRLMASSGTKDAELDAISAVEVCITMLNGANSTVRLDVLALAVEVLCGQAFVGAADGLALRARVEALRRIVTWQAAAALAADCAFSYWSRELLSAYFAAAWRTPSRAQRLPYALAALRDAARLLRRARYILALASLSPSLARSRAHISCIASSSSSL
jgi:hypothetical protein